jgi:DNA polymerase-4
MAARTILHVDMDAFYAAVEQERRPDLRGRPVVIGGDGDPQKRGVVSTASYEARGFGIHSGMPLRTAYRLCPDAVFLPVDFPAYRAASATMHAILRDTGARVESLGLDEAFLDCTELAQPGDAIAREIKQRIRTELRLTASVGVGPNKLVSKVASGLQKPDGLTVIGEADVEARLAPLPVTVLWGIGPKTAAHLRDRFGISTVGGLAGIPTERLQAAFGQRQGAYFARIARGIDDSPVVTEWEPKSISRERTFQVDLQQLDAIRVVIQRLAAEVAADLRDEGYQAATITLKVRLVPFHTLTRSCTLERPIDDAGALADVALGLLERAGVNRPVRLLGVRAAKLSSAAPPPQEDLSATDRSP